MWFPPPIWRIFWSLVSIVVRRSIDNRLMIGVFSNGMRTIYPKRGKTMKHKGSLEIYLVQLTLNNKLFSTKRQWILSLYVLYLTCRQLFVIQKRKKNSFGWSNQFVCNAFVSSFCYYILLNRSSNLLHRKDYIKRRDLLICLLLLFIIHHLDEHFSFLDRSLVKIESNISCYSWLQIASIQ